MKTNQLLKSKKFFKKFCTKIRLEQTKDTTHFLNCLKDHFNSFDENKFIIYLSKNENQTPSIGPSTFFEFLDLNIPTQFNCIPKHENLWKTFFYKNLSSEQIYKKYYSISKRYHSWKQQNAPSEAINSESIKVPIKEEPEKEKQSFNKISIRIPELLEDPEKLYCVCKRPYGEGEQMMGLT